MSDRSRVELTDVLPRLDLPGLLLGEGDLVAGAVLLVKVINEGGTTYMQSRASTSVSWMEVVGMLQSGLEAAMRDVANNSSGL